MQQIRRSKASNNRICMLLYAFKWLMPVGLRPRECLDSPPSAQQISSSSGSICCLLTSLPDLVRVFLLDSAKTTKNIWRFPHELCISSNWEAWSCFVLNQILSPVHIPGSTHNSSTSLHPRCVTAGWNRNDDVHALMETFEGQARFSSRERSPGIAAASPGTSITRVRSSRIAMWYRTQCQQCGETLKARTVIDGVTSGRQD